MRPFGVRNVSKYSMMLDLETMCPKNDWKTYSFFPFLRSGIRFFNTTWQKIELSEIACLFSSPEVNCGQSTLTSSSVFTIQEIFVLGNPLKTNFWSIKTHVACFMLVFQTKSVPNWATGNLQEFCTINYSRNRRLLVEEYRYIGQLRVECVHSRGNLGSVQEEKLFGLILEESYRFWTGKSPRLVGERFWNRSFEEQTTLESKGRLFHIPASKYLVQ